jgi:hypothetical protein
MTAIEALNTLTASQGATFILSYQDCEKCDRIHSRVEIELPDGYSWDSELSGPFSGIGVTSECGQDWTELYEQMYQVIDHPVIVD